MGGETAAAVVAPAAGAVWLVPVAAEREGGTLKEDVVTEKDPAGETIADGRKTYVPNAVNVRRRDGGRMAVAVKKHIHITVIIMTMRTAAAWTEETAAVMVQA